MFSLFSGRVQNSGMLTHSEILMMNKGHLVTNNTPNGEDLSKYDDPNKKKHIPKKKKSWLGFFTP